MKPTRGCWAIGVVSAGTEISRTHARPGVAVSRMFSRNRTQSLSLHVSPFINVMDVAVKNLDVREGIKSGKYFAASVWLYERESCLSGTQLPL